MSQEQYNTLLSNLLREKCALAKLRVELEGRKEKLYRSYREFRHLARNCRNKKKGEKCKKAKLQARIKPTALCSVIDKENSIESLLDLLHYIYNYYCGYALCLPQSSCPSADFFVTCCDCDFV